MNKAALSTPQVERALAQRYAAPAYAFMLQVRNRTGYNGPVRTCDAMAMSLYPSRGLDLEGIEIKVSRSDWTKELAEPDKAHALAKFCDRWWLAVGHPDIVRPGELPANWGLLVPKGDKMVCKVEAPKLTAEPMTRAVLCGIFRNMSERMGAMIERESLRSELEAKYQAGLARATEAESYKLTSLTKKYDELIRSLNEFRIASGVSINTYQAGKIGEAVRVVMSGGASQFQAQMKNIVRQIDDLKRSAMRDLSDCEPDCTIDWMI